MDNIPKWRDARKCVPSDYGQQLCLVQSSCQGGEGLRYPRLLHYDIMNKFWCEANPSCCIPELRKPIEWEFVCNWVPVEKIMDLLGWPD